jgi:hypothetical protein
MDYTALTYKEIKDAAKEMVSRQVVEGSKGFTTLESFETIRSHFWENCSEVIYKITVRLTADAAVWSEKSSRIDTITDILQFEKVPNVEVLKTEDIDHSRIYQLWKKGTIFHLEGSVLLVKLPDRWFAARTWYDKNDDEAPLNATIVKELLPKKYLLFSLQDGEIKLFNSDKPYISLPPPSSEDIQTALNEYFVGIGLQKMLSFRFLREDTDPADHSGTYRNSVFELDTQLEFLRTAISFDAKGLQVAPLAGEIVKDCISEDVWKESLCWSAGEKLSFTVELRYRKDRADASWGKPTVTSVDPTPSPLRSKHRLQVSYGKNDRGEHIIAATSIVMKE